MLSLDRSDNRFIIKNHMSLRKLFNWFSLFWEGKWNFWAKVFSDCINNRAATVNHNPQSRNKVSKNGRYLLLLVSKALSNNPLHLPSHLYTILLGQFQSNYTVVFRSFRLMQIDLNAEGEAIFVYMLVISCHELAQFCF